MKNHGWFSVGSAALAALLAIGTGAASAQQMYPNAPYSATPRVDQRQAQQEQRIHQGMRSGQLTQREAWRLQQQQRRIRQMERRAKADGVVTRQERREIRAAQEHASRSIQRQKHDAQRY